MEFEEAHQAFMEYHLSRRTGERKGRLLRGHQYAEKLLLQNVWWPLFGTLDNLHPEYEVYDWNRKSQFLDFAFLPAFGRFGLECDGYQSHVKDMDREKFSYALNRDTFLTGIGWKMIHFSFDDIQRRPEVCQMLLQMVISPRLLRKGIDRPLPVTEKEILLLAWRLGRHVRPKDVTDAFDIDFRTARNRLRSLTAKGLLAPIETGRGVRAYELRELALNYLH
ncbi:hypothetical protein EHV15_15855 [Paenibacillus oralis]|uniref:DNA-binding response regulator n=1 Tax=Paenibacillus oralis TaxID=2490856 RepID=A0A3P3U1L9_9BACL|nr:hypothetical protein [Paenibacillus oralis]RRJ64231.1 hypothetical protein EHV15_15855 [Paenibacillus oralis]